jgi:LuxR family transcriptional regulator, maltose regulon positive regulatory protein
VTGRQLRTLRLAASGYTNDEIGRRCFMHVDTVKGDLRRVRDELGAQNTTHAVALAAKRGLLGHPVALIPPPHAGARPTGTGWPA